MPLIRDATVVSLLTMFSRVLGYLRDILIARHLGASVVNDIFIIALRLPNMFRALFGEGAFSITFIPIFSGIKATRGLGSAKEFAQYIQMILICILLVLSVLLYIFMPAVISVTAPGIEQFDLAVELTRITLPYLLCISLVAFYGGILNSNRQYFAFAMTPVILNLTLIAAAFIHTSAMIYNFTYAVTVAGVLELVWILYFAWRGNLLVPLSKILHTADLKVFFTRIGPSAISSSVMQINVWIDTILASMIPNAISYLYYADRINQLPLALTATALQTISLPLVSGLFQSQKIQEALKIQYQAMSLILLLCIPASFGLYFFANEITAMLFFSGNFDMTAVRNTAAVLAIFALALPANGLMKVLMNSFYAIGDTKTPLKFAILGMGLNVILSLLLMPYFLQVGLALATLFSAWLNTMGLGYMLWKKGLNSINKAIYSQALLYCIAAIFAIGFAHNIVEPINIRHVHMSLVLKILTAVLCYFALTYKLFIHLHNNYKIK